ncbi:axonemal dynein light intermediate polypeptide 1-like [Genypterus blacodes]|uniref:axonemal dynein light intermediate polypeptide 1-like n=1 Tax=Genypterus blacodes TaxID=154954 RepID=UPI003F75DFB1
MRRLKGNARQPAVSSSGATSKQKLAERQTPKTQIAESLLRYDKPVMLGTTQDTGRRVCHKPLSTGPVPGALRQKTSSNSSEAIRQQTEEILNAILPPREWKEGNQLWIQQVSTMPCSRTDVVHLESQLKIKLQLMQARQTGICPVRRELYSQCFDELIRQVTINCAERGLLLSRVREEIQMTIGIYHRLYESSVGYGMRTILLAEKNKDDMEKKVIDLQKEKEDIVVELDEQLEKRDKIIKKEVERREAAILKHTENIEELKETIVDLKAQLQQTFTAPK